jgi:hypothetical protein
MFNLNIKIGKKLIYKGSEYIDIPNGTIVQAISYNHCQDYLIMDHEIGSILVKNKNGLKLLKHNVAAQNIKLKKRGDYYWKDEKKYIYKVLLDKTEEDYV